MTEYKDIKGLRSGRLVAREYVGDGKWMCDCDCGGTKIVRGNDLRKGVLKSCGCLGVGKLIDITGQTFNGYYVIERSGNGVPVKWKCKCEKCGNVFDVDSYYLRHGLANPCECNKHNFRGIHSPTYKHGASKTRLYRIWQGMLNRCRNPNSGRFHCYGGRGISVCEDWHEFETFKVWALSHGYSDELTIDRINVDGNYEPVNCRWATIVEQARNRRPRNKKQ